MSGTKVLVAAVLAASIVAPVSAVEVKPYGFVHMTYTEAWNRVNQTESPNQAVSQNAVANQDRVAANMSARGTRFGLKMTGGKGPWDSDLAGVIELDFIGIRNPSAATDAAATAPRIRLANMKMSKGMHTFTLGQDWTEAIAPLNPFSVHHVVQSLGTGAGNLYNRLAQIRWDADWMKGADTTVVTKVAAVRPHSADSSPAGSTFTGTEGTSSGDLSGGPMWQALAELQHKMDGRTWRLGAGVQYLRRSFVGPVTAPTGATNKRSTELLYAAHWVAPILASLEFQGEAFYGKGGEALQALNTGTAITDPTGGGHITSRNSRGGWGQLTYKFMPGWRVAGMYAIENMERTGLSATSAHMNEEMVGSLTWDVSPELAMSVEGGRIHTVFAGNGTGGVGTDPGNAKYVGFASQYKF